MNGTQRRIMWERRLAAWRRSGIALQPYCAAKLLSYSSMKRWRDRVGAGQKNRQRQTPAQSCAVIPIEVVGTASRVEPVTTAIEIQLRGGRAIVIDGEVDGARLARLIGIVERAP